MSKGFENFALAHTAPSVGISAADVGMLSAPALSRRTEIANAASTIDLNSPLYASDKAAPTPQIPGAVQQAIKDGKQIKFTSATDDPDYVLNSDGQLVKNTDPNHKASADGSLKIGVQSKDLQGKNLQDKSVIDAIKHDAEMQRQAAKEMIRLYQQAHPKEAVPPWMQELANKQPQLPELATAAPQDAGPTAGPSGSNGPSGAAPENGFSQRCANDGDPGSSFRGNGGFDNNGYFRGNGSEGDGTVWSGGRSQNGDVMGNGEQAKAADVYNYLKAHQFNDGFVMNDASCSGVLGNIQTECHFKTGDINRGEGAHGMCQWEGDRWSGPNGLANFAAHFPQMLQDEQKFKSHLDSHLSEEQKSAIYKTVVDDVNQTIQKYGVKELWTNKYVQMEFMYAELEGREHKTLAHMERAQSDPRYSPSTAAGIWQADFERSAAWNRQPRLNNAEAIHSKIVRGDFDSPGTTPAVAADDHRKKTSSVS